MSVPDHLVVLVVLDEKAVRGHIVTVDDDVRVGNVARATNTVAVVCPPCPDVIEDDVFAVDDHAARRVARLRKTDTEEHIMKSCRVGGYIVAECIAASNLQ